MATLSALDRRQRIQAAVAAVLLTLAVVTAVTQEGLFPLAASALASGYALSTLWRLFVRDEGE